MIADKFCSVGCKKLKVGGLEVGEIVQLHIIGKYLILNYPSFT